MTRGVVLPAARMPVVVTELDVAEPGPGQVLVKMEACGICHSDLFISGLEKQVLTPLVLGHEGIGRVEKLGAGVTIVAPAIASGLRSWPRRAVTCEWCRTGRERHCPRQTNWGYNAPRALAGYASVTAQHLARVPDGLDAAEAAPLCCAGWTAYRGVRRGVQPGATVAIFGLGGLGDFAVQYARAVVLRVAGVEIGAEAGTGAGGWRGDNGAGGKRRRTLQKQYGGVDAAVVLTASPAAIGQALAVPQTLRDGGAGWLGATFEIPVIDTVLKGIMTSSAPSPRRPTS